MNQDQPFFARDTEQDDSRSRTLEGKEVVRGSSEVTPRRELTAEERVVSMLHKSSTWGRSPMIAQQEYIAPDTVRLIEVKTRTFDPDSEPDSILLGQIELSNITRGEYVLLRNPERAAFPKLGKWSVLVTYMKREFKQLDDKESTRAPGSDEEEKDKEDPKKEKDHGQK